jgi:hypothetical protein
MLDFLWAGEGVFGMELACDAPDEDSGGDREGEGARLNVRTLKEKGAGVWPAALSSDSLG